MLARNVLVAMACALSLCWTPGAIPGPAVAAATTAPSTPATDSPSDSASASPGAGNTGRAPLMIVLDASGSMKLPDDSESRMKMAQRAVHSLINDLPDDAAVGLTVYGTHTSADQGQKAAGCRDVTVLRPVAPLDADALSDAVDAVQPSGYSPIGQALQEAAAALPSSGQRTILLVSDGFDYCTPPDPCTVAGNLAAAASGLTIHTLGVQVDDAARSQLQCIAAATGGSYTDGGDGSGETTGPTDASQQLSDRLATGYQRPATSYRPSGRAIEGAAEPSPKAPAMTPGNYLDSSFTRGSYSADGGTKNGTIRYYRIPLGARMTPWASASVIGDVRAEDYHSMGLRLALVNVDDDECLPAVDANVSSGESDPMPIATAQVGGLTPNTGDWAAACRSGSPLYLRAERLGEYRYGRPLPVEIQLRAEPSIDSAADSRPASIGSTLTPPTASPASPANGGVGFEDALPMKPGATISDTIVAGETRYYAVPLTWGQRLIYRLLPTGLGTPADESTPTATVRVLGPLRAPVDAHQEQNSGFRWQPDTKGLTGDTTVPVTYANRFAEDQKIRGSAVAGIHYLAVSLSPSKDAPGYTVPFTVSVAVDGAADGGPQYLPGAVAGQTSGTSGSGSGQLTARSQSSAAAAAGSAGTGSPGWLWALSGAAAALVLASGIAIVRRRSSGSRRHR